MVKKGQAYPCFLTEDEINEIRAYQEANKLNPGIYGQFAKCRDMSLEEIQSKIDAGIPYVVRLKSDGNTDEPAHISVDDGIRGELSMPENTQDTVILKTNGIPTYHFAHVIDDHFMRTTHVVRGAEWIPSLPIHVELFTKLGFEMPIFCHTGQLMKIDEEGNKRKLSKRKDPELSLDYYRNEGYHPDAVREYLLTILNSNFEEWRIANPDAPVSEFDFTLTILSFRSMMMRWAVFNPIPFTVFSILSLPVEITLQSSLGDIDERIILAVLPPTPDTVMSWR